VGYLTFLTQIKILPSIQCNFWFIHKAKQVQQIRV